MIGQEQRADAGPITSAAGKRAEPMRLEILSVGMLGTQCYVLSAESAASCLIIDPGAEAGRIRRAAAGRTIEAILLTHGHFDHIGAVADLMDPGTRLMIHPLDAPMLTDPALNAGSGLLGRDVTAPAATDLIQEGQSLSLAGLTLQVLHTPGHTPGSVCFLCEDQLFTGDTLFDHGWGRTDLPGGDDRDMFLSLRRLIPLSKKYTIHPGHAS